MLRDVVVGIVYAIRYVINMGEVYGSLTLGNVFFNPTTKTVKLELPALRATVDRQGLTVQEDYRKLKEILKTLSSVAKEISLRTVLLKASELCDLQNVGKIA